MSLEILKFILQLIRPKIFDKTFGFLICSMVLLDKTQISNNYLFSRIFAMY